MGQGWGKGGADEGAGVGQDGAGVGQAKGLG